MCEHAMPYLRIVTHGKLLQTKGIMLRMLTARHFKRNYERFLLARLPTQRENIRLCRVASAMASVFLDRFPAVGGIGNMHAKITLN